MIWTCTSETPPPRGLAVLGFYPELAPGTCFRVVRRRTAVPDESDNSYICFSWGYIPISASEPAFWCALPEEPV